MDVAAEVRAEAARQSVTVTALAERAGMSVKTCSRKLHGRSRITTGDLWRFGDALGVSAATLMARAEHAERARGSMRDPRGLGAGVAGALDLDLAEEPPEAQPEQRAHGRRLVVGDGAFVAEHVGEPRVADAEVAGERTDGDAPLAHLSGDGGHKGPLAVGDAQRPSAHAVSVANLASAARDMVTNRHRGSLAADVAALREHGDGRGVA